MKSMNSDRAVTLAELVILLVVIVVFVALLPPAISLVRKRGGKVNERSNRNRIAAAVKYFAGIGASPGTRERLQPRFATITRSISLGGEELPSGTRLEVVSTDGLIVYVRHRAGEYPSPISATDLK